MKSSWVVLCVIAFAATKCAADVSFVPPASQPFSVRVMMTKPASSLRSADMALPVKQPVPEFPLRLRGLVIDEVVVSFTVDSDGTPTKIKIVKHSQKEFDEAVLTAVSAWRFIPAKLKGKAVAMDLEYGIRFDIPFEP